VSFSLTIISRFLFDKESVELSFFENKRGISSFLKKDFLT